MTAPEAAELVSAYLPLANSIANRWGRRWPWLHDCFRSAAAYALWRAAIVWTPDKPYAFGPAVHVAVRRACVRRVQVEYRKAPEAFRSPPLDDDLEPLGHIADGRDDLSAVDAEDLIAAAELHPADAEVLRGVLAGETFAAIGEAMGVSGARARQRLVRAGKRIRATMGD